jgi:DNA-binding MarR family transcriptional regulator
LLAKLTIVSRTKTGAGDADRAWRAAELLHAGAIHLLRRLRRHDSRSGVGPARLSALSVLVFGGPRTLGELAAVEQVRPPTMTRIVAGLEKGRLVRRRADPADARRVVLEATARGRVLLEAGRRRRVEDLAQGLRELPEEDLARLERAAELMERLARR